MSERQSKLVGEMTAHNTKQLKQFFEGAAMEGDWQLIYAASHNGCIISLPAEGGGQVRLRIVARYQHEYPYLELRAERMGGSEDGDQAGSGAKGGASKDEDLAGSGAKGGASKKKKRSKRK